MKKLLLVLALLVLAVPAEAKVWKIDYAKSKLSFTGLQAGRPFGGVFGSWEGVLDFDPDHTESAKIDVTINMASSATGDKQRDEALPQKDWFDVAAFPKAIYHVVKLEKVDDMHFEMKGQLTIKGKTHEVSLPFTFMPETAGMRMKGETDVDRSQFDIGMGEWAGEALVAHKVTIDIDVLMN
ncbi:MAG: YceI family protein [Proteobacteria bacterium]|nr:YceI family protein [Pseudomonadota bacterium]